MASRRKQEQSIRPPSRQGDGNPGTRSGQPNPENVPSPPNEHKSGYGGELGEPRTSTDQHETPKRT
jgi:hypothetical protein